MKISKSRLRLLIENLLFEVDEKYQGIIDDIKSTKGMISGLKRAYSYITGGKYNPDFLKSMSKEDKEKFLDNLVNQLKAIVEKPNLIKFATSDQAKGSSAYAYFDTFKEEEKTKFELVFLVDNIQKKILKEKLKGETLAKFIDDLIFHEFMHIENYFANNETNFSGVKDLMIDLSKLDDEFYKKRYTAFEKSSLIDYYKNELDPSTERGIDEIRVRISHFRSNNNLRQALEYSKTNKLSSIVDKYGDTNAPWLFMIDYQNNSIDDLEGKMSKIAKSSKLVQNIKV
jgi:hypothetical protein